MHADSAVFGLTTGSGVEIDDNKKECMKANVRGLVMAMVYVVPALALLGGVRDLVLPSTRALADGYGFCCDGGLLLKPIHSACRLTVSKMTHTKCLQIS